jgi:hypothetical protein
VELARTEEELDPSAVTTEETVYTSRMPGGLDDENLIQVNVSVSQTAGSAITNPVSGKRGRGGEGIGVGNSGFALGGGRGGRIRFWGNNYAQEPLLFTGREREGRRSVLVIQG